MSGLLLFLDFEKAFATLEWPFIYKTFEHFGFGPSLLNWLKVFYSNSESCILNNGWESNFFLAQPGSQARLPSVTSSIHSFRRDTCQCNPPKKGDSWHNCEGQRN